MRNRGSSKIKNNNWLVITENLLMLERGRDELLLANYNDLRPLYVRRGKKYVTAFLKAASELGSYERITRTFPQEADLIDTLLDHGIVVPRPPLNGPKPASISPDELCLSHRKHISLFLLISQSCNMDCIYCLNGTRTYQKDKDLKMDANLAFTSVERCLDALEAKGCLEVVFFGGEPLLNWPLAKEVILHCESSLKKRNPEKEIKYHVTSNLSFIPADLIEWAKSYNITFLCDVDGPQSVHDGARTFRGGRPSHKIVTKNVERLVKAGLKVDLRATVTSLNHDRLPEITKHHKALGGKSSAFIPVNPVNSDEDILPPRLLPSLRRLLSGITAVYESRVWEDAELYPFNQYAPRLLPGARSVVGCGAPCGNTPVVAVNGDVYPCIYLVGIKKFFIGNMADGTYPDTRLLEGLCGSLHVDRMEECQSCPWRYLCGGGCPLGRLMGESSSLSPRLASYWKRIRCDYTRKVLELLLWRRAEEAAARLLGNGARDEASAVAPAVLC